QHKYSPLFRIVHDLTKRYRDPRNIIFHDELSDLRPFISGKGFELLNNFSSTHGEKNIAPNSSSQNRSSAALNFPINAFHSFIVSHSWRAAANLAWRRRLRCMMGWL